MNSDAPLSDNPLNALQEGGSSQTVKVQLRLREMIYSGELQAGTRLTELGLVDRMNVSRTPIRAALIRLEQEGLLQPWPGGGFAVRTFSETDVADSIELRGTLEGLAARLAAERGVDDDVLLRATQCLNEIDQVLQATTLDDEAFSDYVRLNAEFHGLLGQLSGSPVLQRELDRVGSLPFASASGFVVAQAHTPQARHMLVVAQDQHRQVLDAVVRREGARAEAIMREHARLAERNLRDAVHNPLVPRGHVVGMRLIRPD